LGEEDFVRGGAMSDLTEEFSEEPESELRVARFGNKNKLPQTPDLSELVRAAKRQAPFVLDDFSGSNAYQRKKP
jgi:hypothetical protein